MEENNREIYYINLGSTTLYFHVFSSTEVIFRGCPFKLPRQKLIDFISTAKVLGLKAGRL